MQFRTPATTGFYFHLNNFMWILICRDKSKSLACNNCFSSKVLQHQLGIHATGIFFCKNSY